jgi:hypothetical protein
MTRQSALVRQSATARARAHRGKRQCHFHCGRSERGLGAVIRVIGLGDGGERVFVAWPGRGARCGRRAGRRSSRIRERFDAGQCQRKAAQATHRNDEERRKQGQKPERAIHYSQVVPRGRGIVKRPERQLGRAGAGPILLWTRKYAAQSRFVRAPGNQPRQRSGGGHRSDARCK